MITAIPMAGQSRRFTVEGYTTPKTLLKLPNDNTILFELVGSLAPEMLITIARQEKRDLFLRELETITKFYNVAHEYVWLEESRGALDTLLKAQHHFTKRSDQELVIAYCDGFIRNGIADFINTMRDEEAESGMIVFRSSDPRFGYWDGNEVAPKKANSQWACSGVFYFRSMERFFTKARIVNGIERGIPSALYEAIPYSIHESRVVDLGTPQDYEDYLKATGR